MGNDHKKHFIDLKKCTSHMLSWDDTVICTKGALCVRHLGQPLCQGFANLRVNAWLVLAPVELFKWQVSSLGLKCCSGNVGRGLKHHCCNKVIWDLENTAKGTCRVRDHTSVGRNGQDWNTPSEFGNLQRSDGGVRFKALFSIKDQLIDWF